ncbi:MAG: hypothetical protein ACXAD7_14880, partial [Candidatus Kariarchaeaceae archaeon]
MKNQTKIVTIFFTILFIVNPVVNAKINAYAMPQNSTPQLDKEGNHTYPGWDLERKFAIYYDPNYPLLANIGLQVFDSTSLVYHNTYFIPIQNWTEFENAIETEEYWIKIYFVQSDLDGITLDQTRNWTEFASFLLQAESSAHHIIGSGSTNKLNDSLVDLTQGAPIPPNIHFDGSEVIDAELAYFYPLWEIGEILAVDNDRSYQRVAEDFRVLGIQYFANNLENLVNKQIEPVDPLGEVDTLARTDAWDQKMESMNTIHQVLPNGQKRGINSLTPVPDTGLVFVQDVEQTNRALGLDQESDTFTIADIMPFSGIEGPAAEVIDTVLQMLIKFGGSKLGLSEETAFEIANSLKVIGKLIANTATGEGDVDQTLKGILLELGNLVPIPEKLKDFFPLFVDAFFLISGDLEDILSFGQTLISTIFGQVAKMGNQSDGIKAMLNVLESVLLNGVELVDRITTAQSAANAKGESFEVFSEIQSFIFEKLLNFTTYNWLAEIIGSANSTVANEVSQVMKLLIPIVKAVVNGDYSDLIGEVPNVVTYLVSKFSKSNETSSQASAASALGLHLATDASLSSKFSGAIKVITNLYHIGMNLYQQFGDLAGNIFELIQDGKNTAADTIRDLIANLLIAAQDLLFDTGVYTEQQIRNFANSLFQLYIDASTTGLNSKANLRQLIVDAFTTFTFPTTTPEASLLIDSLALFGSIVIPNIPMPFGAEFRELAIQFIDLVLTEVAEAGDLVKEAVFTVIDVIFGLIAILDVGGPAQALFVDGPDDFDISGKITDAAKQRIVSNFSNRTFNLFKLIISEFVNNTKPFEPYIRLFQNTFVTLITAVTSSTGGAIQAILQGILVQGVELYLSEVWGLDVSVAMKLVLGLFDGLFSGEASKTIGNVIGETVTVTEAIQVVKDALIAKGVVSQSTMDIIEFAITALFDLENLFTNILDFIITQLKAALIRFLTNLITRLTSRLSEFLDGLEILKFAGTIGFAGADFLGLELSYDLSITPNLVWDNEGFVQWIMDIIFKGVNDLEFPNIGDLFKTLLSFLSITP